ncbi:MAG: hypothetical protein FJ405_16405, partial [Verrucomicrobia bacterium]|nr:hypothetical protein [Verrucomicrobiota bacterium]
MKPFQPGRPTAWGLLAAAALVSSPSLDGLRAATLFEDNFDADSSANWSVQSSSADFTVEFAFDYSAVQYSYQDPVTSVIANLVIPSAPRSAAGGTKALKLTVNKNDDVAATSGVSAYPKNQLFSGNYALQFDLWLNYNGNVAGGTGSTEFATFGINHVGDTVNWGGDPTTGDGVWFAVSGENGASRDYRAYQFNTATSKPVELLGANAGLIGTDPFSQPLFGDRFTSPPFENLGCIGKRWVAVEVRQLNGELSWSIDGFVIARRANTSGFDAGTIMLGTMDVFASIAEPRTQNYALFDNVRVVSIEDAPLSVVAVRASDPDADEPSRDPAVLTVTREGSDNTRELQVGYRIAGKAARGVDYEDLAGVVTLPAGVDTADIVITPLDDLAGEQEEDVIVTLVPGAGYELFKDIKASARITDSGDFTRVSVAVADRFTYERLEADTARLTLSRQGDLSVPLSVGINVSGPAIEGADFEALGTSATFEIGSATATLVVVPVDDSATEVHEDVVVTLQPGLDYVLQGATSASVTIIDDDRAEGLVLFEDNFDVDSSEGWAVKFGAANNVEDYTAAFAYDYSADGIPPAPGSGGSTLGLKATVNKADALASASAVNLFLKNRVFGGDYAVRFNMFVTYAVAAGTTEHAIFGLNHSGTGTNRHGAVGTDGLWFAVETDGSGSGGGRSYTRYFSTNSATAPGFEAKPFGQFTQYFSKPPYLASGAASGQWVDVELAQIRGAINCTLNGVLVFSTVTRS